VRDPATWIPCKGVDLGDMGPKMGYNSKNNGWARFDQVRIPRSHLLQRIVKVDREGSVELVGDPRYLYAVMMDIRTQLIQHSGMKLLQASTIALRYSAVRRQFRSDPKDRKKETRLLDYQTQ
jgi:acyl-CoA oxidase